MVLGDRGEESTVRKSMVEGGATDGEEARTMRRSMMEAAEGPTVEKGLGGEGVKEVEGGEIRGAAGAGVRASLELKGHEKGKGPVLKETKWERGWNKKGTKLKRKWNGAGKKTKRERAGTPLELKRNERGTGPERKGNGKETKRDRLQK